MRTVVAPLIALAAWLVSRPAYCAAPGSGDPGFGSVVRTVWNTNVISVQGTDIRISNLILALTFLLVAWGASRLVSRQIMRRLLSRFGIHEGAAIALQSLSFYALFFLLGVIALHMASIPVTVFTILGGAAAIGLGFGSQTFVENFVGGLVILIERPIRIGDLIEVDGTLGNVEHIGLRSTRIRSISNINIIVPNTSIVGSKVINWTLSDLTIRTSVTVGVAYGSPTEKVRDLILKAVVGNEHVLKNPEPVVFFRNFGDNSLDFEVFFWIELNRPMARWGTESDIRFDIDRLFREAGIVIAFPQRDVHLDTARPLEVRIARD